MTTSAPVPISAPLTAITPEPTPRRAPRALGIHVAALSMGESTKTEIAAFESRFEEARCAYEERHGDAARLQTSTAIFAAGYTPPQRSESSRRSSSVSILHGRDVSNVSSADFKGQALRAASISLSVPPRRRVGLLVAGGDDDDTDHGESSAHAIGGPIVIE
jgi:hypothetical protein